MIEILPLTFDNVAYAVQLAKELHAMGNYGRSGPPFDWDFTFATMHRIVAMDTYYFRLCRVHGEYTGAVVGHLETFFFSPKLLALEDAWFVRPKTPERTKAAVMLMRGFIEWALDVKKAALIQSGDVADIDSFAVDTLYRQLGFTRFGSVFKFQRTE